LSQADRRFIAQHGGTDEPFNESESETFQFQSPHLSDPSSSTKATQNDTDYDQGYVTNQAGVSKDMLTFLHNFYQNFPEKRKADLYLTSESYGGRKPAPSPKCLR
jgi:Serine carboxypeptidase